MRITLSRGICLVAAFAATFSTAHALKTRDLSPWYTDYATVLEGAAISSPSKILGGHELEGIIGGKNPVRGQDSGGCVFADIEQHEEFTIDLGQTRTLGLIRYEAWLPRRTPIRLRIESSTESALGPWKLLFDTQSPYAGHTIGIDDVPARWIHVDLGDNTDGRGSYVHRLRVQPRYHLPPAGDVAKDLAGKLRRDLPELAAYWKAVDEQKWDQAADALIAFYAAQADPVKRDPNFKPQDRVEKWLNNTVEDGGNTYHFESSDWNWHALKPGSPTPALGMLPGAYVIFHMLTSAYLASGDEKYARKAAELVTDWLQDMPCPGWHADYEGNLIEGWTGLTTAGRCAAISYMLKTFSAENKYFSRDLKTNLVLSVWQHLDMLHSTRTEVGGNWLTNVNSSLFTVASDHPEFALQKQWMADSLVSFEQSLMTDVFPCGREVEDSTMYVPIASGQLTGQYARIREVGIKLKPELEQRMALLYDAIAWTSYPDGSGPTVGDCGRLASLPPGGPFVPTTYMDLYDRPDFKYMNSYGKEGSVPAQTSRSFAGWYVMRTPWEERPFEDAREMFFKNSQVGPKLNRAHSHLDQLEVTVYAYGRELLTDPGMTGYGLPSNAVMRATASHNTICVDDTDQPDGAAGRENAWITASGADFVDGIFHTHPTQMQRRQILFLKSGKGLPDYWLVHDRVSGRADEHTIDSNFHFSVGADPVVEGASVRTTYTTGGNLLIYGAGISPIPTLNGYNIADNKRGEVPAKCARYRIKGVTPVKFDTFLVPYKGPSAPVFSAEELTPDQQERRHTASAFVVATARGKDVVMVNEEPNQTLSFGNGKLVSDGLAVILRYDKNGRLTYAFQFGGAETKYAGEKAIAIGSGKTFSEKFP
ncbi:MAG: alginate lyase family protein [Armatimonadota bacterium]|nr:alginate lyase family protein [Armatimonadota bacterium]